jgi:hypothetical protein
MKRVIHHSPEMNRIEKLQINRRKGYSFFFFFFLCVFNFLRKRRDPFAE